MRDNDAMKEGTTYRRDSAGLSPRQFAAVTLAVGVGSVLATATTAAQIKEPHTSPPAGRNLAIYRRFIERCFNAGDLTVLDEFVAQKYQDHEYLAATNLPGPETLKVDILGVRKTLQHLEMTIEDIVESGDKVWARTIVRGQDAASGKRVVFTAIDICRFEDGKMVEHWGVPDRFALLHQLGRLPPGVG
jgi:predicted ester cyclase